MNKIITLAFLSVAFFFAGSVNAQAKKRLPAKKTANKPMRAVPKPGAVLPDSMPQEQYTRVKITTDMGDIVVRLYNKTPQHRDNFIRLVKDHFYDSVLFHRVINSFMIQGGDSTSKYAAPGQPLGNGDVGYTIPAEFDPALFHKKGALCAARTDNPEKASSGCQFYIVQGKKSSDGELDFIQAKKGITYTPAQRMTYKVNGGTPHLDMEYTVFGEVESGIEAVDKIAAVATDAYKRPVADIRMKMEIVQQ